MKNKQIFKIIILSFFIIGIGFSFFLYIKNFILFNNVLILGKNTFTITIVFLFLFLLRNYLFIPSTVIIIALGYLFNNFLLTFAISLIGVGIGLFHTYYIGYLFKGDIEKFKYYKNIKPYFEQYKNNGFKTTIIASFLPFFPTDFVCYAAGISKYNLYKFLIAGLLGELPLVLLYSYLGNNISKYIDFLNKAVYIFIFILILIYIFLKIFSYEKGRNTGLSKKNIKDNLNRF